MKFFIMSLLERIHTHDQILTQTRFAFGGANLALEAGSDQLLSAMGKSQESRQVEGGMCIGVYSHVLALF